VKRKVSGGAKDDPCYLTDRISTAAALLPGGADDSSVKLASAAPTGESSARLQLQMLVRRQGR
jgi:hypothetical protein